jgi:hypothetical protein
MRRGMPDIGAFCAHNQPALHQMEIHPVQND